MNTKLVSESLLSAFVLSSDAYAAPVLFDDRIVFAAQTTPQSVQDFEAVAAGSSFEGMELEVGNMRFSGGVSPENLVPTNVIAPGGGCISVNFDIFEIDGSQYACSSVSNQADLRIDFLASVTAWGADFTDIGDGVRHTKISFYDTSDTLISSVVASGQSDREKTFFGIDLDGLQAGHMTFSFLVNMSDGKTYDTFGMDNVAFSTARGTPEPSPVPLPASMLLLGGALMGFAGLKSITKASAEVR